MTEPEQKTENDAEEGEDEIIEEEEEEEEDEEDEEKEFQEEVEVVKPVKKRRCQRRKKISQICLDFEDIEEEVEEEIDVDDVDEEGGDEEEEEDEESYEVSYGPSVLSAISFVWENEIYEFDELCDPGNIETIYRRYPVETPTLDEVGGVRYLQMCQALNITPTMRVLHSLSQDEMNLSHCNVGSKNIRAICAALETNNIVKRLLMKYNKLKVDDCYYIGLILENNEKLSYLDFTGCRVGPGGLELLISHLPLNEYVVDLNLSKCNIRDEGMKFLAYVLTRNNAIQSLDLSYNNLGEESGDSLALVFKMNASLTKLILRYNNLFEPASMKGFFRSLISNNSISYLDLSWNGMNGEEMAGYISNFIKRSGSIRYLDLSDNRFAGIAIAELKKGLTKSKFLETFKIGKNPLSPEDLDVILAAAKANESLKVLDLEDLWVKKSFLKMLKKIQQEREIEVRYAGMLGNYEVIGPDYPKVILQRAQFEAQKPKSVKKRKDFGHLMWTLGDEPLTEDDFMTRVKKFKAKISKELFPELIKQFTIPKVQLIDVVAMRAKYLSIFPESKPPPPPKPKKGAKGEVQVQPEETVEKPAEDAAEEAQVLEGLTALDEEGELEIEDEGLEVELDISLEEEPQDDNEGEEEELNGEEEEEEAENEDEQEEI